MKYSLELKVNQPREKTFTLMADPSNMKHWQEGLQNYEVIEGKAGEEGAVARIKYLMGKREMEMTEKLALVQKPDKYVTQYQAKGMWNEVAITFFEEGKTTTRMVIDNEFRGKGILKLMLWIMPGAFKKQTQKYMDDFKKFAESV